MPNLDGTGPLGLGPMTGRGLGLCRGRRRVVSRGRGLGRGLGRMRLGLRRRNRLRGRWRRV